MMERQGDSQVRVMLVDLDNYVPKNHLLRQIKAKVDFPFIYDKVKDLYKAGGRPSIDPVVLVKMWLIGYLYGIDSERRLEQEVHMHLAYRWFLGIALDQRVPDHSTFSENRHGRFKGTTLFQDIFDGIVEQCKTVGLVQSSAVVTDSTHIKANASMDSKEVVTVTKSPSQYLRDLQAEAERLNDEQRQKRGGGKRGPQAGPRTPQRSRAQSATDEDAGMLARTGKPTGFHYLGHVTIDPTHGIIVEAPATAADISDHEPYVESIARAKRRCPQITEAAADAGYDYLEVHKGLHDLGVTSYTPHYERHAVATVKYSVHDFHYEAKTDTYRCPANRYLRVTYVKSGQFVRIYAAKTSDCKTCPLQGNCLSGSARFRRIKRAIHQNYADEAVERIGTPRCRSLQRLRRIWCEGTFALMKARHRLGRAMRRGLDNMTEQLLMTATVVNMKRMVAAM